MNGFHLDLENFHQNSWEKRFLTLHFLWLWWGKPRPMDFFPPCSQDGTPKNFFWGYFYFFHSSSLQILWIGLETLTMGRNLSRLILTQWNFFWHEKEFLFWAILMFNFQQTRSHNKVALSRSWIWKTNSCRGRKDVNLMNLQSQSYKTEQESNVFSQVTVVLLFPNIIFYSNYASWGNKRYDFAPILCPVDFLQMLNPVLCPQ